LRTFAAAESIQSSHSPAVREIQAGDITANSYDDPIPISALEFGWYGRGYVTEVAKLVAGGRLIEKEMPWK
jgi:hypothetical protein